MTTTGKFGFALAGSSLAIFLAPIAWSALSTHACFDGGRCTCGNPIFLDSKIAFRMKLRNNFLERYAVNALSSATRSMPQV